MIKMSNINKSNSKHKKIFIITIVLLCIIMIVPMSVFAWFSNKRYLTTMTKVTSPAIINIGAGNKENCKYIDLSGIDVEDDETSKDFIFCVHSTATSGKYKIQLAHTTNIAFNYKIFPARIVDKTGETVVKYHSKLKNQDLYYEKISDEILGNYINMDSGSQIANDSKHKDTYGNYTNVQKNAEPLYWQTNNAIIVDDTNSEGFVDYYVLEVSWDKTKVKNDKETDMVYITAGMVN